jgi:hypothetical protein
LHFCSVSGDPQLGQVREGSGSELDGLLSRSGREAGGSSIAWIVRYFAGTGVGVGASSLSTIPAGVRSVSIGVVSGVGGAGAGVALSA